MQAKSNHERAVELFKSLNARRNMPPAEKRAVRDRDILAAHRAMTVAAERAARERTPENMATMTAAAEELRAVLGNLGGAYLNRLLRTE